MAGNSASKDLPSMLGEAFRLYFVDVGLSRLCPDDQKYAKCVERKTTWISEISAEALVIM